MRIVEFPSVAECRRDIRFRFNTGFRVNTRFRFSTRLRVRSRFGINAPIGALRRKARKDQVADLSKARHMQGQSRRGQGQMPCRVRSLGAHVVVDDVVALDVVVVGVVHAVVVVVADVV